MNAHASPRVFDYSSMKKELRIRKPQEFSHVYTNGHSWVNNLLVLKALHVGENHESRFGFTAAKRTGTKVARNTIKRRLRESIEHTAVKDGWDMVFVARQKAEMVSYQDLYHAVQSILGQAKLLNTSLYQEKT